MRKIVVRQRIDVVDVLDVSQVHLIKNRSRLLQINVFPQSFPHGFQIWTMMWTTCDVLDVSINQDTQTWGSFSDVGAPSIFDLRVCTHT